METKSRENSMRHKWLQLIPAWVQVVLAVGAVLVAVGVTYEDVQSLKGKVATIELNSLQQIRISGEIKNLQIQIEQGNRTQEQTNRSVDKLSDSVIDLGNAVSNLQGQIEAKQVRLKRGRE